VNFRRLRLGFGFVAVLAIATATAGFAQYDPNTRVPEPVPTASPIPSPTASEGPRRGRRAAPPPGVSPTPDDATPQPPQFTTLDGVWEIEAQPLGKRLATYSYLNIATTGANITGYWQKGGKGAKIPMTGSFDGRLISMTVAMPDGTSLTFTGYVESFADMVGVFRNGDKDPGTAFTAQHRKKVKAS
jgi:hypothetical protein